MKAKKKPLGTKHRIREKKEKRIALAVKVAILIAIISISAFLINSMLNQPSTNQSVNSTSEPKAAIVDHLSLTYPNQTFTQTATNTLKQAGCTVDYYPGENVTVDFYKNLPTHGYSIIILRVHSGFIKGGGASIFLFSSESYSTQKYVYEQLTDQIALTRLQEGGPTYFGVNENFVKSSMKGTFNNAIIITMGCNGLQYTTMAKAFTKKGAKVYIGYSEPVIASYTDQATTHLLQHFLIEKRTLKESVQETFKEIGADPSYNSLLVYYPLEAGNYTIQNIASILITNTAEIQHKALYQKRKNDNF